MTERMIGDFELRADEVQVKACKAQTETWGPFVSKGAFYLTSERIIWLRARWNIIPSSDVVIKLDQIATCVADDGFNRHRVLLTFKDGSKRTFHVLVGVEASDVADAINGARGKSPISTS